MVKVNTSLHYHDWNMEYWLQALSQKGYATHLQTIRHAVIFSQLIGAERAIETGLSAFQHGLAMAEVLADLSVDIETLIAALVYASVVYTDLPMEEIVLQLGAMVMKLVNGVRKMAILSQLGELKHPVQADNVRKMILAMVDDPRVVLIKLVDRLCILRNQLHLPSTIRKQLAQEGMAIYAPLAHRLGIGILKWELEDLAFRYLNPVIYREIAVALKAKRLEREALVQDIIQTLQITLQTAGITHTEIYGRAKHIYSIYRKMQRKQLSFNEIYDVIALRVLVDSEAICYHVLSIVYHLWEAIPSEFDDYIAKPKDNGYQSLHTAVKGSQGHVFEVQIRTYAMHTLSEMGMAAHWKYKEGIRTLPAYHEKRITWLREVLAWQQELTKSLSDNVELEQPFLEERVYIFTPQGEILDLPVGATVLDFAYYVHTQLGHRCKGAKVNSRLVPLNHKLTTGDRVEILTSRMEKPSRDWLNPHFHYLQTSRAKAKVLQWFRLQETSMHKEMDVDKIPPSQTVTSSLLAIPQQATANVTHVYAEGVGQLLTKQAKCCSPLPPDPIIGYVTLGRGVSIHKQLCPNIIRATKKQRQRFLKVYWGKVKRK